MRKHSGKQGNLSVKCEPLVLLFLFLLLELFDAEPFLLVLLLLVLALSHQQVLPASHATRQWSKTTMI